jgi:hypothetical protein
MAAPTQERFSVETACGEAHCRTRGPVEEEDGRPRVAGTLNFDAAQLRAVAGSTRADEIGDKAVAARCPPR